MMDLGTFFQNLFDYILNINMIVFLVFFIMIFHVLIHIFRDRKYIKLFRQLEENKSVSMEELREFPLINIVVPAWKEGNNFKKCLESLSSLSYPNIKVIVNAGGSEETINIAQSFKDDTRFIILSQKAGEGKVKVINNCLNQISKGLIYIIDADIILTDDIIDKMVNVLLEKNENVVVSKYRPYKNLESKDIVKYILLNRLNVHKDIFPKHVNWISANTLMKFNVMKSVNRFSEKRLSDDGLSMGNDITAKGFKIFFFNDLKVETYYPDNLKTYFNQNSRWIENALFSAFKNNKMKVLRFFLLAILSFYILTIPILYFFNLYLFYIGILIYLSIYLKKIRKIILFQSTNTINTIKIRPIFYFKLIFYIFFDAILNIMVFFEILFYRKAYKKRKNLID